MTLDIWMIATAHQAGGYRDDAPGIVHTEIEGSDA